LTTRRSATFDATNSSAITPAPSGAGFFLRRPPAPEEQRPSIAR
jgi:hypothetical protein